MDGASVAEKKESSPKKPSLVIERVQGLREMQELVPYLSHNDQLRSFVMKNFRDPNTLILTSPAYEGSCVVASIFEHDFFGGKICVLVWAQNPKHFPVGKALEVVEQWAESRDCHMICSFLDENGPWKRLPAYTRLTGLKAYRMVMAKSLVGGE